MAALAPGGSLGLFAALATKGFQRMVAYRGATVAGVLTNFFFGLLRAYVLIAVFDASRAAEIGGYTLTDAITYTALTQALIAAIHIWGWSEVMSAIRSGEIVTHLTKPYDFYGFHLAKDVGRGLFQLLFRGLPILLLYPVIFDLTWPKGLGHLLAIGLSTLLAILISFNWRFSVNLAAFWLVDAAGVARLAYLMMTFLSGFLVPVALFPDWLRFVVNLTPMPAMVNTPIEVYLGLVRGPELVVALGTQVVWLGIMTVVAKVGFDRGVRQLVSQGG